jgi:transcriptional regulator
VYLPQTFTVSNSAEILGSLRATGVGHLVTSDASSFVSSFIPFVVDDALTLMDGHFARANQHWRNISVDGTPGLMIVTGAEGYVSPSWYPSKAETGQVVPTWNYEVIHLHGRLRIVDTVEFVADVVRRLTEQHESGRTVPWSVDDAPSDYLQRMYGAIVGLQFSIERVEAKRKMSQNKTIEDQRGVANGLAAGDLRAQQLSIEMSGP